MQKELRRSATDCKIFGVCGGIAEYLGIDSNVVRLIWVAITLFAGAGFWLYIIAAFLLPKEELGDRDLKDVIDPEKVSQEKDLKDVIHPEGAEQEKDLKDVINS